MNGLPPGFVLDQPDPMALPPGFVLDKPPERSVKPDDFWPVRLAKGIYQGVVSGATLPGDVYAGRAKLPSSGAVPGSVEFGSPESAGERVADLVGLANPINPAVRSGDRAIAGVARNVARRPAPVPTAEGLKEASDAGYAAVRGLGVDLDPRIAPPFAQRAKMKLDEAGFDAELAGQTHKVLDRLASPPGEAGARTVFSFGNLDTARKTLRNIAGNFNNKSDAAAASRAIGWLDDFAAQIPPQAVLAGDAAAAQKLLTGARGDWAASLRVNRLTGDLDNAVTGAVERGELGAQVANSGRNADNAIRQQLKSLLRSKKDLAGFTPEEIAAIKKVAKGSVGTNIARNTGNLLGGGLGGLAAVYGLGGGLAGLATGNPMALAAATLPVAGVGLKGLSTRTTTKRANELAELLAKRSPTYEHRQAAIPLEPISVARQRELIRALLLGQEQQ